MKATAISNTSSVLKLDPTEFHVATIGSDITRRTKAATLRNSAHGRVDPTR
jgi:hypothetical protein